MAYGKIKADAIIYDNSGSDVEKTIASLAASAPTANPTFTGDVTLTGASNNVVFDASDNALEFADNAKATFGTGSDIVIQHTGSVSEITNAVGELQIKNIANSPLKLYTNNNVRVTIANDGHITTSNSISDSKGDVRDIPYNGNSGAYTLVAADAGKVVGGDTSWTIPASTFSAGNTVTLLNLGGSALGITASALTTLYNTADGANIKASTITLGARGMATIWFASGSSAYIQSAALTVS